MPSANLEFRKIPSLKFLYEISVDGRYIRNVKSKRYCRIYEEDGEYYCQVRLTGVERYYKRCSILQICKECNIPTISLAEKLRDKLHKNKTSTPVTVILFNNGKRHVFEGITTAAKFLHNHTVSSMQSIRARLKQRREYILGWLVSYRDAETVHR